VTVRWTGTLSKRKKMELSPKARNLVNQHDIGELAEMVVDKDIQLENYRQALVERTNQYHLSHAKILSREAIIEDLGTEFQKLVRYVRARDYNARHDVPKYAEEVAAWQALSPETRKAIEDA
jgi:hypothetical protein